MSCNWETINLRDEGQVFKELAKLQGKRWLHRGQPKPYKCLVPSIDRGPLADLSRPKKLDLERRGINIFRSTARFLHGEERPALVRDTIALMVLRHYGVPTRLLDWTMSPYVAAFFAVECDDGKDGEIWSFSQQLYEDKGGKQWEKWPETTSDGKTPTNFLVEQTAFRLDEPPDWFICSFYPQGFQRHNAQQSSYSMTARFGRDHADAIAELIEDTSACHRYVVKHELKKKLQDKLRKEHGICRRSLFPDSAGAAETVIKEVFSEGQSSSLV